jgi:hypothetical protein
MKSEVMRFIQFCREEADESEREATKSEKLATFTAGNEKVQCQLEAESHRASAKRWRALADYVEHTDPECSDLRNSQVQT